MVLCYCISSLNLICIGHGHCQTTSCDVQRGTSSQVTRRLQWSLGPQPCVTGQGADNPQLLGLRSQASPSCNTAASCFICAADTAACSAVFAACPQSKKLHALKSILDCRSSATAKGDVTVEAVSPLSRSSLTRWHLAHILTQSHPWREMLAHPHLALHAIARPP